MLKQSTLRPEGGQFACGDRVLFEERLQIGRVATIMGTVVSVVCGKASPAKREQRQPKIQPIGKC